MPKGSPGLVKQNNGGEKKENQVRQAQHGWKQDVSQQRDGMTLIDTCNDEAAQRGDKKNAPFRIASRGAQNSDDNNAPRDEVADQEED